MAVACTDKETNLESGHSLSLSHKIRAHSTPGKSLHFLANPRPRKNLSPSGQKSM